jgi:hypothetical protein
MRKRLVAIYSVLVVAIVLLAVFVPSCGGTTGTIEVKATLCGDSWPTQGTGAVNYTLTGPGSPINGTNVTASFTVDPGTWTCDYVSGGPAGTCLESITPASVTVAAGETKTITIEFEYCEDAAIVFDYWTLDGEIWETPTLETIPCHRIDVHFTQWVDGCQGYNVTLNETSKLTITQIGGPPGLVQVYVVNDDCALNKTPEPEGPSPVKKSQVPSVNDDYTVKLGDYRDIPFELPTVLDVHTQWQLVKCLNYTKSINWLGIAGFPFDPGMEHPCVLFELIPPGPGVYTFTLVAEAEVALVGSTDVNPANNKATSPLPLILTVIVP